MNVQVLDARRDVSGGYKVDVSRGERIGRVSSEWFSRPAPAKDGFGRALGRDVLDNLLLQAARSAGSKIFQPCQAVAIDRDGDMQTVRIQERDENSGDEILRAPVVVAAHGSWEPGPLPSQLEKTAARGTCSASRRISPGRRSRPI